MEAATQGSTIQHSRKHRQKCNITKRVKCAIYYSLHQHNKTDNDYVNIPKTVKLQTHNSKQAGKKELTQHNKKLLKHFNRLLHLDNLKQKRKKQTKEDSKKYFLTAYSEKIKSKQQSQQLKEKMNPQTPTKNKIMVQNNQHCKTSNQQHLHYQSL